MPAIFISKGHLFARNINVKGYANSVIKNGKTVLNEDIDEYVSDGVKEYFPGQPKKSMNLPIIETPVRWYGQNFKEWANVLDFGAVGDGKTDDTKAIQALRYISRKPNGFGITLEPARGLAGAPADERLQKVNYWRTDAYEKWMTWYRQVRPYEETGGLDELDALSGK